VFNKGNDHNSFPRDGGILPSSLSASVILQNAVVVWTAYYLYRN